MRTDRDEEDAAAVVAVLRALHSPTDEPVSPSSRWGHLSDPATWKAGPDAWWASGLAE